MTDLNINWAYATNLSQFPVQFNGILLAKRGERTLGLVRVTPELIALQNQGLVDLTKQDVAVNLQVKLVPDTSYTLSDYDDGYIIMFTNASPISVTVPVALDERRTVTLIQQGDGQITIIAGPNVTLQNRLGLNKTAGKYAQATLVVIVNPNNTSSQVNLGGDLT